MGWICRHCGAENDYAVTVCPVCEHLYGSRTRFSQEHRLERIDRMLYRLPERSIHAVRVNRGLSLILAVLLVICGVSIFTSRPALSDGSGALLPRMQQRLSALGQVVSNRISNGNARAAAGFVRAGETIRRRTGSLQGTSSDGSPAGQLPVQVSCSRWPSIFPAGGRAGSGRSTGRDACWRGPCVPGSARCRPGLRT